MCLFHPPVPLYLHLPSNQVDVGVTYFLPGAWPVLLICIGLYFLVVAARYRVSWPVITGLVNLVLGAILLYQTLTADWKSWYFLWPLIFSALGAGLGMLLQVNSTLRVVISFWSCSSRSRCVG